MKKNYCGIVVDASVARAAGTTDIPTSRHCRIFLHGLRDKKNCDCVFSTELRKEWKRHASLLSTKWLTSMYSRRRVFYLAPVERYEMRERLNECAHTLASQGQETRENKIAAALAKDAHLVEAALQVGKRVVSLDDAIRSYLRTCAKENTDLKSIVWVNPNNPEEHADEWILSGAPLDRQRTLGYSP